MNSLFRVLALIISLGLTIQTQAEISKVNGFQLKSCNQKNKCLILNTTTATSGSFTQLMTFSDFTVEIKENKKLRNFKGQFGYLDLELNKLVITQNSGKEIEFSLKDLSEQAFN